MKFLFGMAAAAVMTCSAETVFKETFDNMDNWVKSDFKVSDGADGKLVLADGGAKTSEDARFYSYSSKLDKAFSNEGKDLVIQFSVRHGQKIDCGGGYLKIFPSTLDQEKMTGDSDYNIMFGPDICGSSNKKVHVIFNYKGENHLIKKTISCSDDEFTHVYTLIVKPDNTYEVRIDGTKKESGSLTEDWDMLLPKKIKDPAESKPADWVDDSMMDDPEDVKPEGYDDIQEEIVDPEAEKPDDWDDEDDGEWEAPTIPNPEYKGPWSAKRISNPAYKGPWVHPEIDNPEYVDDASLYSYADIGAVGIDVWQVKSGSVFDNIIITDAVEEAEALLADTYTKDIVAEKEAVEKAKAEKAAADAAAAKAAAEADEEDDEDDEEEEEEEVAAKEEL